MDVTPAPDDSLRRLIDRASTHLSPRLAGWVQWTFSRWPGRVFTASATGFRRIEIFDRSMTIAAQIFTSIFPLLLMAATWLGPDTSKALGDVMGLPAETTALLDQVLEGGDTASFGLAGALFVLISATSLSRALTRAYAAVWLLPRPTLGLRGAWRWVAALLALVLAVVVTFTLARRLSGEPPLGLGGTILAFGLDVALAIFMPWVLMGGQVAPRRLLPGAVLVGTVLLLVRPGIAAWMPHSIEVSAARYGSIGVAFTYLACLYVLSFCWLGAAVVGQVIADDDGLLGRWVHDERRRHTGRGDEGDIIVRDG